MNKEMYQRLEGRLIYLAHTQPNITYSVSVISQFMHDPRAVHQQVVYRVLRYLKAYQGKGILVKRNSKIKCSVYTNADYVGSPVDRRSTTGYCTFVGGNLVSWSKKQSVVARSSAKEEFRAMAVGVCKLWVKIILEDLKFSWSGHMRLHCDNKSAISIAHNLVQRDQTKRIEIHRHFIKEKLESGLICTPYVPTGHQLADVLTKGLSSDVFHDNISKLGMEDLYSTT